MPSLKVVAVAALRALPQSVPAFEVIGAPFTAWPRHGRVDRLPRVGKVSRSRVDNRARESRERRSRMYVATRYVTILPDDANYPRYGGPETVVSAAGAPVACIAIFPDRDIPHRARRASGRSGEPGVRLDAVRVLTALSLRLLDSYVS